MPLLTHSEFKIFPRFKFFLIIAELGFFLLASGDWHKFNLNRQHRFRRLQDRLGLGMTWTQTLTDTFILTDTWGCSLWGCKLSCCSILFVFLAFLLFFVFLLLGSLCCADFLGSQLRSRVYKSTTICVVFWDRTRLFRLRDRVFLDDLSIVFLCLLLISTSLFALWYRVDQ